MNAPLAIRFVTALSGVALVLLPAHVQTLGAAATAIGVLVAIVAPGRLGAGVAVAAFAVTWILASGLHAAPGAVRTVLAAAALYVLCESTALAAFVPLRAEVDAAVIRQWIRASRTPLAIAAALIVVDLVVPRTDGSALIEFGGLVGVVILVGVATRAVQRHPGAPRS